MSFESKWGRDDQLGAMNLLTPDHLLNGISLVQSGRIYDLAQTLEQGMPAPGFHGGFYANINYTPESGEEWHRVNLGEIENGYSAANMRISMSDQSGTHIDGLNHVSVKVDGRYLTYGGIPFSDILTTLGTDKLGIERMPPLVTRGVLIDIAAHQGVAELPIGYAIQPEELDSALEHQDLEVSEGDAVLVRCGWGRHWNDPAKYMEGEPGIGRACAEWAVEHGVVAWGMDNFGIDPIPFETPGEALPIHIEMLVKNGIRLLENLDLDGLAGDRVHEFCLIVAPLKIRGATGSPIRPFALA